MLEKDNGRPPTDSYTPFPYNFFYHPTRFDRGDVHRHPKSGQRLGGLAHASLEGVLNVVGGSM